MMNRLLVVFVKNPVLGKVKTRLAKSIGDAAALKVYLKLLDHARVVASHVSCDVAVYYSDFIDQEDKWDNGKFSKHVQHGIDIGQRMHNAISDGLNRGYDSVCLIGGDIYDLSSADIEEAFDLLKTKDIVVGPAEDGGYYLIAMKQAQQSIFQLSQWSSASVYEETITQINKAQLTYATTRILNDIDYIEDTEGTDLLP